MRLDCFFYLFEGCSQASNNLIPNGDNGDAKECMMMDISFKTANLVSTHNHTDEAGHLGKFSAFLKKWRSLGKNAHGMLEGGLRCEWLRF